MRWSDCITYKSSFWSDEATLNVLKSMKKIGRYNLKIGIDIGSLEGRNFAHLCSTAEWNQVASCMRQFRKWRSVGPISKLCAKRTSSIRFLIQLFSLWSSICNSRLLFGNTGELVWGYSSQINIFPPLCCILDTPNKKKHTHTICDHLWA